jgi:Protein of unknown function (DUF3800)
MELWGDESGEPTFTNMERPLFIVGTMVCADPHLPQELLSLRTRLAHQGHDLPEGFHSSKNPQEVRANVLNVLCQRKVETCATVIDKRGVPREYRDPEQLYQWAWYQHHKYFLPKIVSKTEPLLMVISTYGTDSSRTRLERALRSGINRCLPDATSKPRLAYWPASSHPCLQASDLILWAIQRSETQGDHTFRDQLKNQIREVRHLY